MGVNRRTFSEEQRAWVAERARAGVPVAEIAAGLNAAFGTAFIVKQVRGLVSAAAAAAQPQLGGVDTSAAEFGVRGLELGVTGPQGMGAVIGSGNPGLLGERTPPPGGAGSMGAGVAARQGAPETAQRANGEPATLDVERPMEIGGGHAAGAAPRPAARPGAAAGGVIQNMDIVELTPAAAQRVMGRFAARAARGADKAFAMVETTEDPRALVAAVSAAKSLVGLARLTLGMDDGAAAGGPAGSFDFNFANVRPRAAGDDDGVRK